MSAEEGNEPESTPADGLYTVGKRLAAERRQQQREVSAVASGLHLRPEVVEALEAGDESRLPAMAFVRGYVKSYARLLGLDENSLLTLMPAAGENRPLPLQRVGVRHRRLRLPVGKWLLWAGALALLVALVVYGVPFVERLLDQREQPVNGDALQLPIDEGVGLIPEAPLPELPAPVDAPEVGDEVPAAPQPEEPQAPEQRPDTPASEPEQVVEAPADKAPAEAEAAAGPATVVLRFTEDSWVEMESNGRKLVVGTQPAGSERTVRAEPPISILLGNAPGVTLSYRGTAVDLQPYQRGKVARLVLED